MKPIQKVNFLNESRFKSAFDLLRLEELFHRQVDHEIDLIHKISFYIIIIITEGQGEHTIDFTRYKYQKGSLLTIRKDQIHRFHKNTTAKGHVLLFTESFLVKHFSKKEINESIQVFNEVISSPVVNLNPKQFDRIMILLDIMQREYQEQYDPFSDSIIRSTLHILTKELSRVKASEAKGLFRKKYLEQFIHFQNLVESYCFETKAVTDYAKKMLHSTKTLNNIVQHVVSKTAKQFVDEIVITQIKRLLINTDKTITEIAYEAGFEEPSNMYKYFKKQSSLTPEAFRKANQ